MDSAPAVAPSMVLLKPNSSAALPALCKLGPDLSVNMKKKRGAEEMWKHPHMLKPLQSSVEITELASHPDSL